MVKHDEMTRYAFISHMEDYMKKLMVAKRKQYQEYVKQYLSELKFGGG